MKGMDKYIFAFLLIASLVMIFASCKQNTTEGDVMQPSSTTETEKTYTSEGTMSTGTRDTMNDHTNGIENGKMDMGTSEVPIKGETTPTN